MTEGAAPYQIGEKIGEGGMGAVYRAWDPVLQRHVALKFMHRSTPEQEERLLQEARAQAQVVHENVCRVYQVGRDERGCFIAMQLLEAVPLSAAGPGLSLEAKIALFRQVAEAVHAAHRLGILHRDLKPSNILVETGEGGARKAYVTDFGLARELGKPGTTVTGTVLGTPQYMSPEQARGEVARLDRRADVFSLGATLYELLTGQPPFAGRSQLQVLYSVVNDEPRPPRQLAPSLPASLEAVVLKCLQKKPDRRYDSARALADDLERYLAGQPVAARPPGFFARAFSKLERHPAISAALAAVILSSLVAGGLWLSGRRRAREREQLAARFGEELAQVEGTLRLSALLPRHDTQGEREAARARMRAIRERARQLGDEALPAALAAVGRGHLALGETDEARALLQQAWDLGERSPATAAALGLSLGAVYQARLQELERVRDPEARKARREALERELRGPAVAALSQVAGAGGELRDYAQARLDFYEQRHDAALRGAAEALRKLPWLYEAQLLEGDVHLALADARRDAGDEAAALAEYRSAEDAYRLAADKARSDPRPEESLCTALAHVLRLRAVREVADVSAEVALAEAACGRARQIAAGRVEVPIALADVYAHAATVRERSGGDPRALIERAAAAAEEGTRLKPELAAPHQQLGLARLLLGLNLTDHGQDGMAQLLAARDSLRRALQLDPSWAPAYSQLGNVLSNLALLEIRRGGDPAAEHAEAVRVLQEGLARWPASASLHGTLGLQHFSRAGWQRERGVDPRPAFADAAAELEKAIALEHSPIDLVNLADVQLARADWELDHAVDPRPSLSAVVSACDRASAADPRWHQPWISRGTLWLYRARFERSAGGDPRPHLREADRAYARAIEIAPADPRVLTRAARPPMDLALYELSQGRSPEEASARGLTLLRRALQIDPRRAEALRRAAALETALGEWRARQHQDPSPRFAAAEELLQKALASAPKGLDNHLQLIELWRARATFKPTRATIESGLRAVDAALRLAPGNPTAERQRAQLNSMLQH